ncbi:MAG: PQQ-dependent sugar dehydrogenase, partial [Thiotrichales bacterium]|nr:PQQ-dependent sugar dehydrogenase [Thiotrichales bacterium]
MTLNNILVFFVMFFVSLTVFADSYSSAEHEYKLETVVSGLRNPWSMEFLPGGDILVTEKSGRLRRVSNDKLLADEIKGLPEIRDKGQGGLLDLAIDPGFEKNQIIYFSYSAPGKGGIGTDVSKAKLVDNKLVDRKTIFKLSPKTNGGYHFGSRLLFGKNGTLFITLGDRGEMERSQDLSDHAGSLIRINLDGSVPGDNPFVKNKQAKPEIYTYGNRNIQGIAMHPETGEVWTVEHGPQGGDELNLMKPGVNYG